MASHIREKSVESYLISRLKELDIDCVKFQPDNRIGMPDRLVLLPDGKVIWIELKTDNGTLSEIQKFRHMELHRQGHKVQVLWCKADVDKFIDKVIHILQYD